MRRVAKFVSVSRRDQWLLVCALWTVSTTRVRLAVLPFRGGRGYCRRVAERKSPATPDRIAWAVDRAGALFGQATCLARALAGHVMLARRGFSSSIRIGVAPGEPGTASCGIVGHAWLERGGRILLGGPDVGRYKLLMTWCNH
jgi:hypothetical protein